MRRVEAREALQHRHVRLLVPIPFGPVGQSGRSMGPDLTAGPMTNRQPARRGTRNRPHSRGTHLDLHALFAALQGMTFDGEKDDQWENLTDILEITAVAAGLKPAHLAGAGLRGLTVPAQLESIAKAHGLVALATPHIRSWRPRPSRIPPALARHLAKREEANRATDENVLWLFADASVRPAIDRAVSGQASVAEALGYPPCCVEEHAEQMLAVRDALYLRYWQAAKQSAPRFDQLLAMAEEVHLDVDVDRTTYDQTLPRYGFVQFLCCRSCFASSVSPAARLNAQMRDLAGSLSPQFERAIRKASLAHVR